MSLLIIAQLPSSPPKFSGLHVLHCITTSDSAGVRYILRIWVPAVFLLFKFGSCGFSMGLILQLFRDSLYLILTLIGFVKCNQWQ